MVNDSEADVERNFASRRRDQKPKKSGIEGSLALRNGCCFQPFDAASCSTWART
jgi:hypothetical protein